MGSNKPTRRELGAGRQMTQRARVDKPFRNYLESWPRDVLIAALASQPEESRFRTLLSLMESDTTATLPTMCRKAQVTMPMMCNLMREAAVAEGTVRMMLSLPQVMEDVGEDAKTKLRTCTVCEGEGEVQEKDGDGTPVGDKKMCLNCEGEGTIRETGDKHARDLLFETAELTNKPRGPLIEQNFDMRDTGLRRTMAMTQDLLEPGP